MQVGRALLALARGPSVAACFLVICVSLACAVASAQQADPQAADEPDIPADDLDRGTPFRSADGFLNAADRKDYATAAEYLDLRNLHGEASELTGEQLARRLQVIVQRAQWRDIDELVDNPDGRRNDSLPDYRDSIGVVDAGGEDVRLLMQRVPRGDGVYIWKVSNATVSLIPQLYQQYGYPPIVESLRRNVPDISIVGFELFKWIAALSASAAAYAAVLLLALAVRRALGSPEKPSHKRVFRFLVLPLGIWAAVLSANLVARSLGRGVLAEALQRVSPVGTLITLWLLFAAANLARDSYAAKLGTTGRSGAAVFLQPATNALKILIAVAAALFYLDKIGVNVTTVVAGLGVGGLAIALALQKPLEDMFGAVTLYSQQPVQVGDFCRIGETTGTIEAIGLRTTRIRTLANTVIAVPNARLAAEPIDNISAREKILYWPMLRLRYDTASEQLQKILQGIRDLLSAHERVLPEGQRVRFKEIAADGLLIEVYAYVATTVWTEYLGIAEELNMRILEIVADAGTSLSPPSRALFVESAGKPFVERPAEKRHA